MIPAKSISQSVALGCALGLLLSACNITGGSPAVAPAISEAGGARTGSPVPVRTLTEADVAVPQAFEFIGKEEAELTQYFGAPALTRSEGEARILQFAVAAPVGPCVLLAVLYEDRGDTPRIRLMSVRENGGKAEEPVTCLRELAFAHQKAGTS